MTATVGVFRRAVDLLPLPSLRTQRGFALAVLLTQAGIAVTGSIRTCIRR